MKTRILTLALTVLTIGLLGSCKKDNGSETPQKNLPAGALKGEFSVAEGKKVHFSKGNLVATINTSGAPTAVVCASLQMSSDIACNQINESTLGHRQGDQIYNP